MDKLFALFDLIESKGKSNLKTEFVIVGLGNPGTNYKNTRHNAGYIALDFITKKLSSELNKSKFSSLCGQAEIGGKKILLLLPQTYMNNSGVAVRAALDYYKLNSENLLVIFDDISLPCGKIRIRTNGSAGGHNGIKSIIEHIGSDKFTRIKIGVGEKPNPEYNLADWVLSNFDEQEKKLLSDRLPDVFSAAELIVEGKTSDAMNKFN